LSFRRIGELSSGFVRRSTRRLESAAAESVWRLLLLRSGAARTPEHDILDEAPDWQSRHPLAEWLRMRRLARKAAVVFFMAGRARQNKGRPWRTC